MTDEKNATDDTQPTTSAGAGDPQLERADEEAARAAAAAEEAAAAAADAEAAADAGTADAEAADEAGEAADEAVEAAAEAEAAATAAAEAPKPKRARKARDAEVAADQAEDAADEAVAAAEAAPDAPAETPAKKRSRTKKAAEETPAATPTRTRDARREAPVGVEVRAQAKYVRTSARKARLVCDHIRGKDVAQARAILAFTPRAAAKDWAKLLESAVANAEHNHELVGEELKIAAVYADEGPTLKRYRPRAMGRATRIRKRTAHLTITLTPKEL
jgi:ribosomal protein L22